jgi:flavin reductase (DIM6/NTAB) family NADH-FMN oxidoreductase RutF
VSWDPPLIAVAVGRAKHTHQAIVRSSAYAVNLLRKEQTDVARVFGTKSGRDADKFAGLAWRHGGTGSPLLEGTAGYLDCRVVQRHEVGDHSLFIGEVVEANACAQQCLVYRREVHQSLFTE